MTLSMGLWLLILFFLHDLIGDLINKSELQIAYVAVIAILLAAIALL